MILIEIVACGPCLWSSTMNMLPAQSWKLWSLGTWFRWTMSTCSGVIRWESYLFFMSITVFEHSKRTILHAFWTHCGWTTSLYNFLELYQWFTVPRLLVLFIVSHGNYSTVCHSSDQDTLSCWLLTTTWGLVINIPLLNVALFSRSLALLLFELQLVLLI